MKRMDVILKCSAVVFRFPASFSAFNAGFLFYWSVSILIPDRPTVYCIQSPPTLLTFTYV